MKRSSRREVVFGLTPSLAAIVLLTASCANGVSADPLLAKRSEIPLDVTLGIQRDLDAFFDVEDVAADGDAELRVAQSPVTGVDPVMSPAIVCAVLVPVGAVVLVPSPSGELELLKDRARARRAALLRLKDAGRIGETWDGEIAAVRACYADEQVDAGEPDCGTIRQLVEDENAGRLRLYERLARGKPVSAAEVGIENGRRTFGRAAPCHYLKPKGKDWTKKNDCDRGQ